jgi:hypothetical protein
VWGGGWWGVVLLCGGVVVFLCVVGGGFFCCAFFFFWISGTSTAGNNRFLTQLTWMTCHWRPLILVQYDTLTLTIPMWPLSELLRWGTTSAVQSEIPSLCGGGHLINTKCILLFLLENRLKYGQCMECLLGQQTVNLDLGVVNWHAATNLKILYEILVALFITF